MDTELKETLALYAPEWGTAKRRLSRGYKLEIRAQAHTSLVRRVLDCLEKDTLKVYRPDDSEAFEARFDSKGALLVNLGANLPVSLREWLPLGCQWIGNVNSGSRPAKVLAYYGHNAAITIFPTDDQTPLGPAAFIGKIYLTDCCLPKDDSPEAVDAFQFIVAHELVHVFDMLRILVPAAMNWRQFYRVVLNEGNKCKAAAAMFRYKAFFLDDYGNENEKAMVAEFWPSRADKWFAACQRVYRGK